MKTILLSLSILIFNIHLSHAQTKKIALRSHSGANSSFTINVPDEFGLGPIDYRVQTPKKKCLKIKPIKAKKIQGSDSIDSIQFCTPLPLLDSTAKQKVSPPKSKPRPKKKEAKKVTKRSTCSLTTVNKTQQIAGEKEPTKTQLAGFVPTESSESLLILFLSISALLFFIVTIQKP